jgi:hypothetical protein
MYIYIYISLYIFWYVPPGFYRLLAGVMSDLVIFSAAQPRSRHRAKVTKMLLCEFQDFSILCDEWLGHLVVVTDASVMLELSRVAWPSSI